MHDYLDKELEKHQIKITEVYYCPHHPLTSECLCRKPGSLLVEKAIAKYRIDPSVSWFIGDKQRDMDAGAAAGVKGILIEPNEDWTSYINQFNTSTKQ
jgi:D-glycero-D-manno-heptose 1,7-bisphosphate phosphatase